MKPVDLDKNPDAVWYCHACAFCGSHSEANAHLVVKPKHVLSPLTTKTGRIITNEEMDCWVREAEQGYVAQVSYPDWTSRTCEICRGTGQVSRYSATDFEGPTDCPDCNGGVVWISPRGYYAAYPGGPFLGGRDSTTAVGS